MNGKYNNFVRPSSPTGVAGPSIPTNPLNGETAKKLYLEEVKDVGEYKPATDVEETYNTRYLSLRSCKTNQISNREISDKDLFLSIQNDEVGTLKIVLDKYPDKIRIQDDYGWSLLMMACQANAIETARELLERKVDTTVRDRAGNSAQSLVIKNKNFALAELLLSYKSKSMESKPSSETGSNTQTHRTGKQKDKYTCNVCNNTYPDRLDHLSSTLHNINASKGKKIPSNFKIPQTNRGYQLMVKVGWDRESGLGPEGTGRKYPIKTAQKRDRKGIGVEKKKIQQESVSVKQMNRRTIARENYNNRRLEADFRRQFY